MFRETENKNAQKTGGKRNGQEKQKSGKKREKDQVHGENPTRLRNTQKDGVCWSFEIDETENGRKQMPEKTQVSKKTQASQAEALKYARRVQGRGLLERIAQIVVNRNFEAQIEREIAKLRKVIVE